MCTINKFIPW
ncbi:hypothetical protein JTY72_21820 [Klebsiella pneumoniae]|nr:hypothetical protein [Klebsiella pneumoniae]HBU5851909.1 hypothetical protein [Klebsiella pneumoniae]